MSLVDEWRRTVFEQAVADIRWAKERETNVVQWALLLYAGLIALDRTLEPLAWVLVALASLELLVVLYWIHKLNLFRWTTRKKIEKTIKGTPAVGFVGSPSDSQDEGAFYVRVKCGVTVIAWALTVISILWPTSTTTTV